MPARYGYSMGSGFFTSPGSTIPKGSADDPYRDSRVAGSDDLVHGIGGGGGAGGGTQAGGTSAQGRIDDTMDDFNRSQEEARRAVDDSMADTQVAIDMAIREIVDAPTPDLGEAIDEYKKSAEAAIGNIILGSQKAAEFQQLQIQGAAATGRLGANAIAIAREGARLTGTLLAQTFAAVGEFQMGAAKEVAGLRALEGDMQMRDRHHRMSAMVSLASVQSQASMTYAGIVAGMHQDRGRMLADMAQLSTSIVLSRESNAVANRQTDAQLSAASLQASTQKTIAGMQIAEEQRQFDHQMELATQTIAAYDAATA